MRPARQGYIAKITRQRGPDTEMESDEEEEERGKEEKERKAQTRRVSEFVPQNCQRSAANVTPWL